MNWAQSLEKKEAQSTEKRELRVRALSKEIEFRLGSGHWAQNKDRIIENWGTEYTQVRGFENWEQSKENRTGN